MVVELKIEIELDAKKITDIITADNIMRTMLKSLTKAQIDVVLTGKISKTIAEVTTDAND